MNHDRARIEEYKHDLDLYGFVVVEDLITAEDAGRLAGLLESLVADLARPEGSDLALRGVLNHTDPADYQMFSALLAHPVCLELARHALGDSFQIVEVTALVRKPGAPAHPLHCTAPAAWFGEQGFPMPEYRMVLPFSWILADLTRENGARLFMPFSHLSSRLPDPERRYRHVARVEAPAGSLVLFNGATWHGLAANESSSHCRVELASGYMPAWYDVRTSGYRMLKPSVWEQMPQEVQDLNRYLAEE
ncbi:MAG: phytanoyl-CoA dioxygenase family protein [bacterium]|nr:phytanoyl-CoA dioxygenase family protein [bacterium]MDE0290557.1 phytanoyl-CoA dioxygenase family protein [bacterium]MDE0436952.1 phytanoyl-CoA dioxygenase family protein [bacterium]